MYQTSNLLSFITPKTFSNSSFLVFFNRNLIITLGLTSCNAIMPKLSTELVEMSSTITDINCINIRISPSIGNYHAFYIQLKYGHVTMIYVLTQ